MGGSGLSGGSGSGDGGKKVVVLNEQARGSIRAIHQTLDCTVGTAGYLVRGD